MRASRIVRAFALLGAALTLAAATGATPAAADEGVSVVGRLPVNQPEGTSGEPRLVTDSMLRRAFLLYHVPGGRLVIQAFHLDTLRLLRTVELPIRSEGRDLVVVDELRGRLLIPYFDAFPQVGIPATFPFAGMAVVNGRTLRLTERWPNPPLTDILRSIQAQVPRLTPVLSGIALYQPEGRFGPQKLLLLFQDDLVVKSGAVLVRNLVWLVQWDALSGEEEWVYQVNACDQILNFRQYLIRSPGHEDANHDGDPDQAVHIACSTRQGGGMAVRIDLDNDGRPTGTERSVPGPLLTENVVSDPGSDRLLFAVFDNGKKSFIVFDGRQSAYVGVIDVTRDLNASFGVDPTTGRVYSLTRDNGLILADARRTPAQQALVFKEFAHPEHGGADQIAVDPARGGRARRVFVRQEGRPYYWVIRDDIGVSFDTPLSDLDRFTIDRAEEPGLTGRSFEATGHAYGVRTLIVGGLQGAAPPAPQSLEGREYARRIGSPCMRFDREIVSGLVSDAALGDSTSRGAAVAADADPGTKQDAVNPVERCWPVPDPLGSGFGQDLWPAAPTDLRPKIEWPFEKAECSGGETAEQRGFRDPTGAGRQVEGFRARAECAPDGDLVDGFARSSFHWPGLQKVGDVRIPEIIVGSAASRVTLRLGERGGVVAVSEAEAREIKIIGIGSIDLVATRAIARAAGRPFTARTEFERVICGVVIGTLIQPGCVDPNLVAQQIDRLLGTRGRAVLPDPDEELAAGTPGGYLASVQRDEVEATSGRALNNDFATQVPGLELVFFNDEPKTGRARQVFQFAGVDASTTYGIYLLGGDFTPPDVDTTTGPLGPTRFITIRSRGAGGTAGEEATTTRTIVERVRNGFSLLARSPGDAFPAIAVWLSVGMPVYLASRRLAFLRSIRGK